MADFDITRVAGNIGAMNALNALTNINKQLSVHQSRLASGKRINSAADDPAGLTIATKMLARSEGLKVALSNIGDAKNLLSVAESGLGRINDILVQMRNKAEAGASDTMGTSERAALVSQMEAYAKQIDDIVAQTKWTSSSPSLIGGTYLNTALTFQTGADQGDTTSLVGLADMRASGGVASLNLADPTGVVAATATGQSGVIDGAAPVVGVRTNALTDQLATDSYKVKVTYSADGTNSTIQLFRSSDTGEANPLIIDADNVAGGSVNTTMTVSLDTGPVSVNFGNGLTVTVDDFAAAGVQTGSMNYTAGSNTFALKNSAATTINGSASAASFAIYMNDIQGKLDIVSGQLSLIGALNGRLTFKEDQVSAAQINTEGAYNRIMNANMAEEQVNASKFTILQQTATAMLAQANAGPQFLLSLFR